MNKTEKLLCEVTGSLKAWSVFVDTNCIDAKDAEKMRKLAQKVRKHNMKLTKRKINERTRQD